MHIASCICRTMVGHSFRNFDRVFGGFSAAYTCLHTLRMGFKPIYTTIWIVYLRVFKRPHICVNSSAGICEITAQTYSSYKEPYIRVLKCAYMRVSWQHGYSCMILMKNTLTRNRQYGGGRGQNSCLCLSAFECLSLLSNNWASRNSYVPLEWLCKILSSVPPISPNGAHRGARSCS